MNEIIESFVIEANELGASSIDTLLSIPTPIEFSMLAGKNRPAIFRNLFKDTFPVEKWKSKEYIVKSMGDSEVSVSITPDGYILFYVKTYNLDTDSTLSMTFTLVLQILFMEHISCFHSKAG